MVLLHNIFATQCLQVPLPDFFWAACACIKDSICWLISEPEHVDGTLLSVIFALDASFATIDYFSQSFLRTLRQKLRSRISKYQDPKWIRTIGSENTVTNLIRREQLTQLAAEAVRIQNRIPDFFNAKARFWKSVMAVSAAVMLVFMAVPYFGRIAILFALPVPLFVMKCKSKKDDIEDECEEIDKKYELLMTSEGAVTLSENSALMSELIAQLDTKLNLINAGAGKKKGRRKRKTAG